MFDRKLSARSKLDSSLHTDFPIFQYNTSIIDLKIFPTKDDDSSNNYLYEYNNNVVYPSYTSINPKKYLINRNFRFYQPVKDAEMLVQLDSLRLKLQASGNSNINDQNKKEVYLSNLKTNKIYNSNESNINHHSSQQENCKNCLHCKEEEQRQLQYMKLIQNEILRGKGSDNDTYSLKSYNLSSCTKKSPNQSPDIDYYSNQTPENENYKEKNSNKTVFIQPHTSIDYTEVDFPELKKYSNKKVLKQSRNLRIKSSLSTNNRLKSAATTLTENKPNQPVKSKLSIMPSSSSSQIATNLLKSNNVQKTVRKSTQSRYRNIYKSSDNSMEIIELRAKTPKSEIHDHYLPPAVSYLDIHAPTLISFLDIRETNSDTNKSISSKIFLKNSKNGGNNLKTATNTNARKYQNTIVINDIIDFGSNIPRQISKRSKNLIF